MKIDYNCPSAEEYIQLRISSGMGTKQIDNSRKALENSLFTVSLKKDNKLIGFGRVVGDKGITYVVSDIMVHSDFQKKGFGTIIMKEIDKYLIENNDEDSYTILIANKPADKLYSKFSFEYTEPNACGMKRTIK